MRREEPPRANLASNGTHLKHFERVVSKLLDASIEPSFSELPAPCSGDSPVATATSSSSTKKQQQVTSLIQCIEPFLHSGFVIVDFGGGSGHLSIPLALRHPDCVVVCVDLDRRRLDQLVSTAATAAPGNIASANAQHRKEEMETTAITNLFTFHGAAQSYRGTLDLAVALHLCGEATDVVLRLAAATTAKCIVAAPCCVGKTSCAVSDPNRWKATGQSQLTIVYPQSRAFRKALSPQQQEQQQHDGVADWNALAKAADYSAMEQARSSRNAVRRTAKALLETDRQRVVEETYGWRTRLTRMEPWEATPKNDILIAWDPAYYDSAEGPLGPDKIDAACSKDLAWTKDHLFCVPIANESPTLDTNNDDGRTQPTTSIPQIDWSKAEAQEIRSILKTGIQQNGRKPYIFEEALSSRKRKMVHAVAEELGLKHWSVNATASGDGKKYRTVAVVPYLVPTDKLQEFKKNGAIVLRNVLSSSELQLLERGIEYNLAHPGPLASTASSDSDPGLFVEDFCNWTRIPEYESILKDSFLPLVAARLMESRTVRIYHDHLLVKEPHTTQDTPFHQDQPFYNISGSQTVSFWIPIDPIPQSSSLQVVAGSHASGSWYLPRTFLLHEAKWFPEGSLPEVPTITDDTGNVLSWALQPGDVVAFHMRTLHGAPGTMDERRRVWSARYMGDDVRHAPRTWVTSPPFPQSVQETIGCGKEMDHSLFPVVYSGK